MENIPLLPPPAPGWAWVVTEVFVGNQVFWATTQQRLPEPPAWWEEMYSSPDWSHGLTALTFAVVAAKKIRDAWKGRAA